MNDRPRSKLKPVKVSETPYSENILLTEAGQQAFLSLIEQGARSGQACGILKVPTSWLTQARREDPDFDERIVLAQETSVAEVLELLKERALAGSTRDAELFLRYTVLDQQQATKARDSRRAEVKQDEREAIEQATAIALDPDRVAEIRKMQEQLQLRPPPQTIDASDTNDDE